MAEFVPSRRAKDDDQMNAAETAETPEDRVPVVVVGHVDAQAIARPSQGAIADAESAVIQVSQISPSEEEVTKVRDVVTALLKVMGIKRVISIDDDYEGSLDDFLHMADIAALTNRASSYADEFDLTEPPEVWRDAIAQRWTQSSDSTRHLLLARAKKETGNSDPDFMPDASALQQYLPDQSLVEFLAWTATDWDSHLNDVIASSQSVPTMVMFDREIGESKDEGLRLAEDLFARDTTNLIYVALLTRTVPKGGESAAWAEMTKVFTKLAPERFVVVSKGDLGPDPESLPRSIKVVLLTHAASSLTTAVKDSIDRSLEAAHSRVADLSPEEFQKMIFTTSMQEGAWEPESLLRVFQVFMRTDVRDALYASPTLWNSATQVRHLCTIDTHEPSSSPVAIQTQQAEMYDQAQHLNSVHLPLELGDVFKTPTGLEYVLAEQPCDLMVRSDGKRYPEIFEALLLRIRNVKPEADRTHLTFELPFYYEDGSTAWVYMNRPLYVPMDALDFTVFNRDGSSRLDLAGVVPEGMWPAWEARFRLISARLNLLRFTLATIGDLYESNTIDKATRKRLSESLLRTDKEAGHQIRSVDAGADTLSYGIARVRRVLPLRARALLSRVALHRARDAFEFDLAAVSSSEG